jgi:hypothetical protein
MLFALEAKTAWYGPVCGPGSDVRAAKARPAGTPELVDHGVPSPDPEHPTAAFTALAANAMFLLPPLNAPVFGEIESDRLPFFPVAQLSPSIFFRPPPIS